MLVEDLLALPVGTRVLGRIEAPAKLCGVIGRFGDGSRFIRWDDGYATIPLGRVREYDEYIAAHTDVDRATRVFLYHDSEAGEEAATAGVPKHFVR